MLKIIKKPIQRRNPPSIYTLIHLQYGQTTTHIHYIYVSTMYLKKNSQTPIHFFKYDKPSHTHPPYSRIHQTLSPPPA